MGLLVLLVMLALQACGADEPRLRLAELGNLDLRAETYFDAPVTGDSGRVQAAFELELRFAQGGNGLCNTLDPSIGGDVNGVPLRLADDGVDGFCWAPMLTAILDLPVGTEGEPLAITVTDGETEIVATFEERAFLAPAPVLVSHADWRFNAGDVITLDWPQPSDFAANFHGEIARAETARDLTAAISLDGRIEIQIPSAGGGPTSYPFAGEVEISLIANPSTQVAECAVARTCEHTQQYRYQHAAIVDL